MMLVELLQANSGWMAALATLFLATGTTALALQNRKLLRQSVMLTSRDRVTELVASVIDPLVDRLKGVKETLELRNLPWAISDEDIATKEIPREHLELFKVSQGRFYYPAPLLGALQPLLDGCFVIFEPGRLPELEQDHPGIIDMIRELDAGLPAINRAARNVAIQVARFLNSERIGPLQSAPTAYAVHLTLASLLMDPVAFQNFLERFPRNDEMQRARQLWLESQEVLLRRLQGVEAIEIALESLVGMLAGAKEKATNAIKELKELRQKYLSEYYIPEYLVQLHKERKLISVDRRLENVRFLEV
jgi:hypothetical protein